MKKIVIILFAVFILAGCSNTLTDIQTTDSAERTNSLTDIRTTDSMEKINDSIDNRLIIDLVTYLNYDSGDIGAHVLSIDLLNSTLDLSKDAFFKVSGEIGWQDSIYPLYVSTKSLVLPNTHLLLSTKVEFSASTENELYFEDYVLVYDYEQSKAEFNKGGQVIATVTLSLDGVRFIPQAFFYDDEGKLAVLCITDGYTFDERNPVSLIFAIKNDVLQLETINNLSSVFDDLELSKINMPTCTQLETNIYGNAQSKTFLWNEGANAVVINPYSGAVKIILDVDRIEKDMPSLDTYREYYGFFSGFNYQSGVYIAQFPNYNNLEGTISVFYSNTGEFLGSVICEENNISLLDKNNNGTGHIDNIKLRPLLFIPQGSL